MSSCHSPHFFRRLLASEYLPNVPEYLSTWDGFCGKGKETSGREEVNLVKGCAYRKEMAVVSLSKSFVFKSLFHNVVTIDEMSLIFDEPQVGC